MDPIIYIVIALYLIAVLLIGYWSSKGNDTVDYMAAGQNNPYWVVGAGYIAEFLSSSSFLGIVGIIYAQGFVQNGAYVGSVVGYMGCIAIFGPLLRRFGQFTIPDFLGDRYDSHLVRALSALVIFIGYILYVSIQFIGVGLLFAMIFDIPYHLAVIIAAGIVGIYTLLGGMKATAYVDVFQLLFAWISAGIIITATVMKGGGMVSIISNARDNHPHIFNTDSITGDPWLIWSLIFIWIFGTLARADTVSRVFLAKNEREVYKAILFTTPFIWAAGLMFFILSMAGSTLFLGLDGQEAENIYLMAADQFVPPLITGIAFAGLLSAAQSTASGQLMVSSLAIGRDIYGRFLGEKIKGRKITEKESVKVVKITLIVMTLLTMGLALMRLSWITTFANLSAATTGPAFLVTWLGGFFWKNGTKQGAAAALIVGPILGGYTFLADFSIPGIPWLVGPVFTVIVTLILYIGISLFTTPTDKSLKVFDNIKKLG